MTPGRAPGSPRNSANSSPVRIYVNFIRETVGLIAVLHTVLLSVRRIQRAGADRPTRRCSASGRPTPVLISSPSRALYCYLQISSGCLQITIWLSADLCLAVCISLSGCLQISVWLSADLYLAVCRSLSGCLHLQNIIFGLHVSQKKVPWHDKMVIWSARS